MEELTQTIAAILTILFYLSLIIIGFRLMFKKNTVYFYVKFQGTDQRGVPFTETRLSASLRNINDLPVWIEGRKQQVAEKYGTKSEFLTFDIRVID
jgi:hypothetical protein